MKNLIAVFVIAAQAAICHPQTAKVIVLSPADAAEAKRLYAEKANVEKKIAELQARIRDAYIGVPVIQEGNPKRYVCPKDSDSTVIWGPTGGPVRCERNGWNYGFEYSDDFKYIVPVPLVTSQSSPLLGNCVGPAILTDNGPTLLK